MFSCFKAYSFFQHSKTWYMLTLLRRNKCRDGAFYLGQNISNWNAPKTISILFQPKKKKVTKIKDQMCLWRFLIFKSESWVPIWNRTIFFISFSFYNLFILIQLSDVMKRKFDNIDYHVVFRWICKIIKHSRGV